MPKVLFKIMNAGFRLLGLDVGPCWVTLGITYPSCDPVFLICNVMIQYLPYWVRIGSL